jgi:hypothetical protein
LGDVGHGAAAVAIPAIPHAIAVSDPLSGDMSGDMSGDIIRASDDFIFWSFIFWIMISDL